MSRNQKLFLAWLNGLVVALIGGIANTAVAWFSAPGVFNFEGGLSHMLQMLGGSAAFHLITYMLKSPFPKFDLEE